MAIPIPGTDIILPGNPITLGISTLSRLFGVDIGGLGSIIGGFVNGGVPNRKIPAGAGEFSALFRDKNEGIFSDINALTAPNDALFNTVEAGFSNMPFGTDSFNPIGAVIQSFGSNREIFNVQASVSERMADLAMGRLQELTQSGNFDFTDIQEQLQGVRDLHDAPLNIADPSEAVAVDFLRAQALAEASVDAENAIQEKLVASGVSQEDISRFNQQGQNDVSRVFQSDFVDRQRQGESVARFGEQEDIFGGFSIDEGSEKSFLSQFSQFLSKRPEFARLSRHTGLLNDELVNVGVLRATGNADEPSSEGISFEEFDDMLANAYQDFLQENPVLGNLNEAVARSTELVNLPEGDRFVPTNQTTDTGGDTITGSDFFDENGLLKGQLTREELQASFPDIDFNELGDEFFKPSEEVPSGETDRTVASQAEQPDANGNYLTTWSNGDVTLEPGVIPIGGTGVVTDPGGGGELRTGAEFFETHPGLKGLMTQAELEASFQAFSFNDLPDEFFRADAPGEGQPGDVGDETRGNLEPGDEGFELPDFLKGITPVTIGGVSVLIAGGKFFNPETGDEVADPDDDTDIDLPKIRLPAIGLTGGLGLTSGQTAGGLLSRETPLVSPLIREKPRQKIGIAPDRPFATFPGTAPAAPLGLLSSGSQSARGLL